MNSFSVLDYVLFGVTLAISLIIGMYFALQRNRGKNDTAKEFLTGNRQMPLLPTALSLLASYTSGIAYLGYPAEMYTMGTAFVWSWPGAVVAMIFSAIFIIPVIFHVESVSIYKYLEDRFDSKLLRRYGVVLFVISSLVYMAVVLYAPSTALSSATGLPTWSLILIVGIVCTIYTSIGGLKAVVWTVNWNCLYFKREGRRGIEGEGMERGKGGRKWLSFIFSLNLLIVN